MEDIRVPFFHFLVHVLSPSLYLFGDAELQLLLCDVKQFIANILILFVFYAIFHLADFLSDPFEFRLQKQDKAVVP